MTPGQTNALEKLWPSMGLELASGQLDFETVFGNSHPVCLEIGFGMGDSLAAQAESNPEMNYIGVEVHRPGVGHLLLRCEEKSLTNVRVFSDDSIEVLQESIPPHSLELVQIYFPDPWHKKRHHKRRLINPAFVDLLASRLKPGGLLHVATDWVPYAESINEVFADRKDFVQSNPPERPKTKFEERGLKLGHEVTDLAWQLRE